MFTLTDCPDHGTTEVPDFATLAALVPVVRECVADSTGTAHANWHRASRHECWACCERVTVNPDRITL